ncbi:MAG: DUF3168 domain-containing protein [Rhodovibrio sp.]|nr:DUF3168 domain-containing protein [Rhodovibrio sp.]
MNVGFELQKAIYQALDGNVTVGGNAVPVYNPPPTDAPYPYIDIGDENSADFSTHTEAARERFVTLSVWSDQPGKSEVYSVLSQMETLLDRAKLTLGTGRAWDVQATSTQITRDLDGRTFTGTMTVRARTQQ